MTDRLILVTNDDGYFSQGIALLAEAAKQFGTVTVVAPDRQQSAASHALSLHSPLRVKDVQPGIKAVDGTPTDCVNLALNGLLERRPDIVLSGVNHGANLGDDLTYSGTVAAAMEGCLLGLPSIAFSFDDYRAQGIEKITDVLSQTLNWCFEHLPPTGSLFNINIPSDVGHIKGRRLTEQGERVYGDAIVTNIDPRGYPYYWIGGNILRSNATAESDIQAIDDGYISVTPLRLDLTDRQLLKSMKDKA